MSAPPHLAARLRTPRDAGAELIRALDRLDRPDRVWKQAAGLLLCRRPRGADRLLTKLQPLARRAGQASLFPGWWPIAEGRMARPV